MKSLNIKKIAFILLLFFSINTTNAQNRYDGYLVIPNELSSYCKESFIDKINNGQIDLESLSFDIKQNIWYVYSDRLNNVLYNNPKGYPNGDKLDLTEKLAVKNVSGNWLHVYSQVYDKTRPIQYNKERGWIKAEFLLLNDFAILNEKSLPKKAMILIALENIDRTQQISDEILKNKFYYQPGIDKNSETGNTAKKFDIYFILKETKGAVLLSRADKLSGSEEQLQGVIAGWMPKSNITAWDHRVCLEPSMVSNTVTEYSGKDIPVFDSKENLDAFRNTQIFNDKIIKTYKLKNSKINPYDMRMPVLANYDNINDIQCKKIAVIANLYRDNGKDESAETERKIQECKNRLETVNILFIIDGTQSMKNYYAAVANSITKIIENNQIKGSTNNLKFGVAIYRDYKDGKDLFDIEPLTNNVKKVTDKILSTKCFSSDNDLPEAQYYGLIEGIKQSGFIKQKNRENSNSNIVILIGDAGNYQPDPKGLTSEKVIQELKDYQASLIAFQVTYGNDESFTTFNWDAQDYIRKTTETIKGSKVILKETQGIINTYELNSDLLMFGRFTYASVKKEPMDVKILEQNIIESVNDYLNRVDVILRKLEDARNGVSNTFTKEFIEYLKKILKFTDKEIEILKTAREITAVGYTSMRFYENQSECFSPVVFLSKAEIQNISGILKPLLNKIKSTTQSKEAFKKAILQQCKAMLGEVSDDNILEKNMNDIWNIILGIDFTGKGSIKRTKLRDMDKLGDDVFNDFFNDFSDKAKNFNKICNNEDYEFKLANQTFYWIPLNEFPGNE